MIKASIITRDQIFVYPQVMILGGKYLAVGLLSHIVSACLTSQESAKHFPREVIPFSISTAIQESRNSSTPSPALGAVSFLVSFRFLFSPSTRCVVESGILSRSLYYIVICERLNIQMHNGQTIYDSQTLTHHLCSSWPRKFQAWSVSASSLWSPTQDQPGKAQYAPLTNDIGRPLLVAPPPASPGQCLQSGRTQSFSFDHYKAFLLSCLPLTLPNTGDGD